MEFDDSRGFDPPLGSLLFVDNSAFGGMDELMDYLNNSSAIAQDSMLPSGSLYHDSIGDELGENKESDEIPRSHNGKINRFEVPTALEDIDVGTDPLIEISIAQDTPLPPEDDGSQLELFAFDKDKDVEYDFWRDAVSGRKPAEVLFEMTEQHGRQEDLKGDFYSWLGRICKDDRGKSKRIRKPRKSADIKTSDSNPQIIAAVCRKYGIDYPLEGTVKSYEDGEDKLDYTVISPFGLFASVSDEIKDIALSGPDEAMSFSIDKDALALARATSRATKENYSVLGREGLANYRSQPRPASAVEFPDAIPDARLPGFLRLLNGGYSKPFVGTINNHTFVARRSSDTSIEFVRNMAIADSFCKMAGLFVPKSKYYPLSNGEAVLLSQYITNGKPLEIAWNEASPLEKMRISEQVIEAYPVISFIGGSLDDGNVIVDDRMNVWFVCNGDSFGYIENGKFNGDFDDRKSPTERTNGYLSLARNPNQRILPLILGDASEGDLLNAAKKYEFVKLIAQLPQDYQTESLIAYAKALDSRARMV